MPSLESNPQSHPFRQLAQAGLMATLAVAGSTTWAQTCEYTITTAAAPVVNPVPSLSMLGVALLAAAMAFVAWRRGKFPGARFMAVALVAAAAMLANQGGGGLVQQAYAAVVSLTNPAGESLTTNPADGETVTFTNNSGVPLVISSVSPALAGCTDGSTLTIGASCSGAASCPVAACSNPNEDINNGCVCLPGYARLQSTNQCVIPNICDIVTFDGRENVCTIF